METSFRDRLAAAGYARVRNELTASAARRTVRAAYEALSRRFAGQFAAAAAAAEEAPRGSELLSDDEFEATVFEDLRPAAGADASDSGNDQSDTGSTGAVALDLDEALISLDNDINEGTGSSPAAPPAPPLPDETAERPAARLARVDSGSWQRRPTTPEPGDWAAATPQRADSDDDGTPIEGVRVGVMVSSETSFVAGEIDVPSPSPKSLLRELTGRHHDSESDSGKTPPHT